MTLGYACGGNASVALLVNGEKQTDCFSQPPADGAPIRRSRYTDLNPEITNSCSESEKGGVNLDYFDLKHTNNLEDGKR